MNFDRVDLEKMGFSGFIPIGVLKSKGCGGLPDEIGIYAVIREERGEPVFLSESVGGHFKGKDPSVPIIVLEEKWVDDSSLLYFGKAGVSLRKRVGQYIEFGKGKDIGHYGGRFIWQLKDSSLLLVAWKPLPQGDPRVEEKVLIKEFEERFGKKPFANIIG